MAGSFLHGDTDSLLRLSNNTVAHAEEINANSTALGNHNAQLAGSSWTGTSHTAFAAVEDARLGDSQKLTNMLQAQGDDTRTVANLYAAVDSDSHHVVGGVSYGVASVING
ncbi:WXG100 family type VII secretion target [Actinosynnema sp. CS-041913]|uniref:WXG100 family type VII secretion target n=1 Tax=Actinosynnema sp. CS-041913 TaxID=3239917 RepID=UPI003D912A91